MKKIAIYGAGGFGREVLMLIDQINFNIPEWEMVGFFDDSLEEGTIINNFNVLGGIDTLNKWKEELAIVFAIGNPRQKKEILNRIGNDKIGYPVLIHPNVQIGNKEFVNIGEGTIITAGNIITININIGKHVILNLSCTIGHDTVIEDYCSFMPNVNISGEVLVKECVYVGTGAKIINQLQVGNNTVVGAGAVVTKSLPDNCTAVGMPAKPVKFHTT